MAFSAAAEARVHDITARRKLHPSPVLVCLDSHLLKLSNVHSQAALPSAGAEHFRGPRKMAMGEFEERKEC